MSKVGWILTRKLDLWWCDQHEINGSDSRATPIFHFMAIEKWIFTARKRSLGQGNIFTSVCQEFCPQGGGVCLSACWDNIPPQELAPPPEQSMLGDTVNERAVRILLECNLVTNQLRRWNTLKRNFKIFREQRSIHCSTLQLTSLTNVAYKLQCDIYLHKYQKRYGWRGLRHQEINHVRIPLQIRVQCILEMCPSWSSVFIYSVVQDVGLGDILSCIWSTCRRIWHCRGKCR